MIKPDQYRTEFQCKPKSTRLTLERPILNYFDSVFFLLVKVDWRLALVV